MKEKLFAAIEAKNIKEVKEIADGEVEKLKEIIDEENFIFCIIENYNKEIFDYLIDHSIINSKNINFYYYYVSGLAINSVEFKKTRNTIFCKQIQIRTNFENSDIHEAIIYKLCSPETAKDTDIESFLKDIDATNMNIILKEVATKYNIKKLPTKIGEDCSKAILAELKQNPEQTIEDSLYNSVKRYEIERKREKAERIDKYIRLGSCAAIGLGVARELTLITESVSLPVLLSTTAIIFAIDLIRDRDNRDLKQVFYNASCKAAENFLIGAAGIAASIAVTSLVGGVVVPTIAGVGAMYALSKYALPKAYSFVDNYINNKESGVSSAAQAL